jgi:hypothetical protein
VPRLQGLRLARDPRGRDDPSERAARGRLRSGGRARVRVRARRRAGGAAAVRHGRPPALLRQRPALPRAVGMGAF